MRNIVFPLICIILISSFVSCIFAQTNILPSDPNIQYLGRIDRTSPTAPVLAWTACEIRANFQGTSLKAKFSSSSSTYYNVFIDTTLTVLPLSPGNNTTYDLASGLTNGVHSVRIFKRDSPWNSQSFNGFILDAGKTLVSPPARRRVKLEIYGDSQTQGAQADVPGAGGDSSALIFDNSYHSYGNLAAQALNAEYSSIAKSGATLSASANLAIPSVYDRYSQSTTAAVWDFTRWQADVVCINLGENDWWNVKPFSISQFENDYIALIQKIRAKYPLAEIILLSGPMYGGNTPQMVSYVTAVKDSMNQRGDSRVYYYHFKTTLSHPGHPRTAEHLACANELINFIKSERVKPVVSLTALKDGANLAPNSKYEITWSASDNNQVLYRSIYYRTATQGWTLVDSSDTNTGSFAWTVPSTSAAGCMVKILAYDLAGNVGVDSSHVPFAIGSTGIRSKGKNANADKSLDQRIFNFDRYDLCGRKLDWTVNSFFRNNDPVYHD